MQFSEVGFSKKLKPIMFVQLVLFLYYAVSSSSLFASVHDYYIWPPLEEPDRRAGLVPSIRSTELYFECDGLAYYKECQGPKYTNGNIYDDSDKCDEPELSHLYLVISFAVIFFVVIFSVVGFSFRKLYLGLYNQLHSIVKFNKVEEASTGRKVLEPVKFAAAFTLFCNFAKNGFVALQNDVCGRFAFNGNSLNEVAWTFALIYAACWLIFFFAALWYPLYLCCGICGHHFRQRRVFRFFRVTYCVAFGSLAVSRAITFFANFSINFDFNYPSWAITSIISFLDVIASLVIDILLITRGGAYDLSKGCFASYGIHPSSKTRNVDETKGAESLSAAAPGALPHDGKEARQTGRSDVVPHYPHPSCKTDNVDEIEGPTSLSSPFRAPHPHRGGSGTVEDVETGKTVTEYYNDGTMKTTKTVLNPDGSTTITTIEGPMSLDDKFAENCSSY